MVTREMLFPSLTSVSLKHSELAESHGMTELIDPIHSISIQMDSYLDCLGDIPQNMCPLN